jgi:TRAP-type mannitol/chloroaromatic compound transport system permease small subunit
MPEVPPHAITAEEYAKIIAMEEKIRNLRLAIVGTGFIGFVFTLFSFSYVYYSNTYHYTSALQQYMLSLCYAILVAIPFIIVIVYFGYRMSKHIYRLGRGKFEPPQVIE